LAYALCSQEFCYSLRLERNKAALTTQARSSSGFARTISEIDLETIEEKSLNELIWERTIKKIGCDKEAFRIIYQALVKGIQARDFQVSLRNW
jgi:hypothetical protein